MCLQICLLFFKKVFVCLFSVLEPLSCFLFLTVEFHIHLLDESEANQKCVLILSVHMICCYERPKIPSLRQWSTAIFSHRAIWGVQSVAMLPHCCSLITPLFFFFFLFFSDHYFTWLTWVTDSRICVQWLRRIQNFSVLAICDFQENSNTWDCPEVIKLEI